MHNSQCIMHNGEIPRFARHDGRGVAFLFLPQIHVFSSDSEKSQNIKRKSPDFFQKKYPMRKFRILSIFLCYKEIKLSGYENNETMDCDVKTIGKHINNALRGNYFFYCTKF